MIRSVMVGSGLLALVPAVQAATPVKQDGAPNRPPPMKPSDLPIYDSPHADYNEYLYTKSIKEDTGYIKSSLLAPVSVVREQVQHMCQQTSAVTGSIRDHYHEMQDRSDWIVKYLREEDNKQQRYGAVAMGGLTGFIFGLRGGIIRRLFYATVGTTAMGFVCFPEETTQIINSNGAVAKQYINIAYNFFYGVKPGDPQLEVKFPELSFPRNLSELTALGASIGSTVAQAVMPPPAKDEKKE